MGLLSRVPAPAPLRSSNSRVQEDRTMSKDVIFAAGPCCSVALTGGALRWVCNLGDSNEFRRETRLPGGVNEGEVRAMHASFDGLTLVTRKGSIHVWTARDGRWRNAGNVLAPSVT